MLSLLFGNSLVQGIQISIPGTPFSVRIPISFPQNNNNQAKVDEQKFQLFKILINDCNDKKFIDQYRKEGASLRSEVKKKLLQEAHITQECLEQKKSRFAAEREDQKIEKANRKIAGVMPACASFWLKNILYEELKDQFSQDSSFRSEEDSEWCARMSTFILLGAVSIAGVCYAYYNYQHAQKHIQKKEAGPAYYHTKEQAINNIVTLIEHSKK